MKLSIVETETIDGVVRFVTLALDYAPPAGADFPGMADIRIQVTGDDKLWGAAVAIPDRATVSTKLRLWYGFDQPNLPRDYAAVPSATDLCARFPRCANETATEEKAKLVARLEALQAGELMAHGPIEGVNGDATYLNGASDHLRLPVHYETPLNSGSQSFSFSTWFYTEGNAANEQRTTPQLLYTHNTPDERTRFELKLQLSSAGKMRLLWFDGDMLSRRPPPTEVVVAADVPLRTWHHAGFTLNAASGAVDFYYDGVKVGSYTFTQPPAAVGCPQFHAATDIMLHEEGDGVLGGKPRAFRSSD